MAAVGMATVGTEALGPMERLKVSLAAAASSTRPSAGHGASTDTLLLQERVQQHLCRVHEVKAHLRHKEGSSSLRQRLHHHHRHRHHHGGEQHHSASTIAVPVNVHVDSLRELRRRFKVLARHQHLCKREDRLLDTDELGVVGQHLQAVYSTPLPKPTNDGGDEYPAAQRIGRCNYDDFGRLKSQVPVAARRYFDWEHFLEFPRDRHGRINTADVFQYIYHAVCLEKTRITLHFYDQEGKGTLTEAELEFYMHDLLHSLPALQHVSESFSSFYVYTAVRRFMFFLDPTVNRKISIAHLMASPVMEELMDLATMGPPPPPPLPRPPPLSSDASEEERANVEAMTASVAGMAAEAFAWQERANKNWFSTENALRIYNMYLELDHDQNGLLSKRELLHYSGYFQQTRLTPVFVDRIFEESITYCLPVPPAAGDIERGEAEGEEGGERGGVSEAEMDYKVFLDFVLAMENRSSPPALRWFFRMLDIEKKHILSSFAVRLFFRDVVRALQEAGFEAPLVEDVATEVFDMARPGDPSRGITLEDLLGCGVGSIIVSMLTDVQSFLNYDQREHLAAAAAAEAAARLEEEEMQTQTMLAQAQVEAEGEEEDGEDAMEGEGMKFNLDEPYDAAGLREEEEEQEEQEQEEQEEEQEDALHAEGLDLAEWEEEEEEEAGEEEEEEKEKKEGKMNGEMHVPDDARLDAKDDGDEEGKDGEEAGEAIFVTEGKRHQSHLVEEEEEQQQQRQRQQQQEKEEEDEEEEEGEEDGEVEGENNQDGGEEEQEHYPKGHCI